MTRNFDGGTVVDILTIFSNSSKINLLYEGQLYIAS